MKNKDRMQFNLKNWRKSKKIRKKKSSKKYIQNIDCRFVSIIWNFFFEIVQLQKVVLIRKK